MFSMENVHINLLGWITLYVLRIKMEERENFSTYIHILFVVFFIRVYIACHMFFFIFATHMIELKLIELRNFIL